MSSRYIPLHGLTIWFLRKYVWRCYTDVLVCIARRLNEVDLAMIYEAVIWQPYARERMYLESLRLHGYEKVSAYARSDAKLTYAPPDIKRHVREVLFGMSHYTNAIEWVALSACNGNMVPLEHAIACIDEMRQTYECNAILERILCVCVSQDCIASVEYICKRMFPHQTHNADTFRLPLRPRTYATLRAHGLKDFVRNGKGILMCIEAGVWINDDIVQMTNDRVLALELCSHAIFHGIGLDWIHTWMSVNEMAACNTDGYDNGSIKWFMDRKIPIHELCAFAHFGTTNVIYTLPHTTADTRALLLAKCPSARDVYRIKPFGFTREVFMRTCSYGDMIECKDFI